MPARVPHPIPYQGSKRRLAAPILSVVAGRRFATLHEPFAGSAALTLAAAAGDVADRYVIGDSLPALASLWQRIIAAPDRTANEYEQIWSAQLGPEGAAAHYLRVRREFNAQPDPVKFLYLVARCVKNAPRFSAAGAFNQSADHRRAGMRPDKMRREMQGASLLLRGRAQAFAGSAEACLAAAGPDDLVYLDPPWQGTTEGPDKRYHRGLARTRLEALLEDLSARSVPWILSYDGSTGKRTYGPPLAGELWGARLALPAGRSSQSTLAGRAEHTTESLYLSPLLSGAPPPAAGVAQALR